MSKAALLKHGDTALKKKAVVDTYHFVSKVQNSDLNLGFSATTRPDLPVSLWTNTNQLYRLSFKRPTCLSMARLKKSTETGVIKIFSFGLQN